MVIVTGEEYALLSMQFAIDIPNFGTGGDPRVLVDLARRAEDAGWDGFFVWFGDEVNLARRGVMADEGLAILEGLWRGQPFAFAGEHYRVETATFLPRPVQEPRIPVWVAALRPGPDAPLRRAARWDGFVPASEDGYLPLDVFARDVARVRELRAAAGAPAGAAYEMVASGATPTDDRTAAIETVAAFEAAGATWWQEIVSDWLGGIDAIRARIAAGPPRS